MSKAEFSFPPNFCSNVTIQIALQHFAGGEEVLYRLLTTCFYPLDPALVHCHHEQCTQLRGGCRAAPLTWMGHDWWSVLPSESDRGYYSCCTHSRCKRGAVGGSKSTRGFYRLPTASMNKPLGPIHTYVFWERAQKNKRWAWSAIIP